MKKIIGVTPRVNKINNQDSFSVYQNYFEAIIKAGALPILLPVADKEDLKQIMANVDGLLVTGGNDVNPSLYGEENTHSSPAELYEDLNDLNLINIALDTNKPILGICKGLQIVNVYFKGSLFQDIETFKKTNKNHNQHNLDPLVGLNSNTYPTRFVKDSVLYEIFDESYNVNSFHHQCIKDVGKMLKVSAYSEDNIIEPIELANKIICVQWHPERLIHDEKHLNIFKYFVSMC